VLYALAARTAHTANGLFFYEREDANQREHVARTTREGRRFNSVTRGEIIEYSVYVYIYSLELLVHY